MYPSSRHVYNLKGQTSPPCTSKFFWLDFVEEWKEARGKSARRPKEKHKINKTMSKLAVLYKDDKNLWSALDLVGTHLEQGKNS